VQTVFRRVIEGRKGLETWINAACLRSAWINATATCSVPHPSGCGRWPMEIDSSRAGRLWERENTWQDRPRPVCARGFNHSCILHNEIGEWAGRFTTTLAERQGSAASTQETRSAFRGVAEFTSPAGDSDRPGALKRVGVPLAITVPIDDRQPIGEASFSSRYGCHQHVVPDLAELGATTAESRHGFRLMPTVGFHRATSTAGMREVGRWPGSAGRALPPE